MKGLIVFLAGKRVLTAALMSATVLATTPSMAETIFGAMAKAYSNNSTLNADRAGVRVTDEGVAVAKSGYRPVVSATADLTTTASRLDGGTHGTRNTGTFGIQINQTLFDGFTVSNNIKSAKTQVLAARENLRNNEQNLLFSAAQAYMDVYLNRQIVILRQKNLEFLDEQLRAAKARSDVGEGTRTDVAQAEASKASAIATLDAAKSDEKIAEANYIQIVGTTPGRLAAAAMASKSLPKSMQQAFSIATGNHPAILASQYAVDAAGYSVKANEGQLLPQVGLVGTVEREEIFSGGISTGTTDSTSASAGIQVTILIYNGGRTSALVRQSKETLGQLPHRGRCGARQCPPGHRSSLFANGISQGTDRCTKVSGGCRATRLERRDRGAQGWPAHHPGRLERAGRRSHRSGIARTGRTGQCRYQLCGSVSRWPIDRIADRTSGCRVQTGRALRSGKGQVDRSAHAGRALISDLSAVCRFQICRQADRLAANCFPAPVEAFFRKSVG